MFNFFKLKKEIKLLVERNTNLGEELRMNKKWLYEEMSRADSLQKEKDENYKDIKIQIYEDILKIEKRFMFVPRSFDV